MKKHKHSEEQTVKLNGNIEEAKQEKKKTQSKILLYSIGTLLKNPEFKKHMKKEYNTDIFIDMT